MIELNNVSKVYRSTNGNIPAVHNLSLQIKNGEIFGVIGYSGAGKSSLIRLFNQLEKPTSGNILIDGFDITQATGRQLRLARQNIGMVFQHFNLLWSRTVAENISFPLEVAGVSKSLRQFRVAELIQLVGLEGRENSYPAELSGGQKQRVGIARALANRPKLLLCDEATSALDPKTTDSILELLLDINKKLNLTIVLITHEMHVVRKICHRVAVIDKGEIVEQGEVIKVFHQPQQEITKRFVKQLTEFDDENITDELLQQVKNGTLLKLTFTGQNTLSPLISDVIHKFQVNVNILQGRIVHASKDVIGTLYIYIEANRTTIQEIVEFIEQQQVTTEVVKHA